MRMVRLSILPLILLAGASAAAQPEPTVLVQLSNFKFSPDKIPFEHGRPYVLRLVNVAEGGHDFTAPSFFAAANVAPPDRRLISKGTVEVPAGQTVDIHLTAPAAGSYKVKCTHTFHKMFGMSGTIVVR